LSIDVLTTTGARASTPSTAGNKILLGKSRGVRLGGFSLDKSIKHSH